MDKQLSVTREKIAGDLSNRRRELGITQQQIADATGMGVRTIKRFESGKFWINLKQLVMICRYLEVDRCDF